MEQGLVNLDLSGSHCSALCLFGLRDLATQGAIRQWLRVNSKAVLNGWRANFYYSEKVQVHMMGIIAMASLRHDYLICAAIVARRLGAGLDSPVAISKARYPRERSKRKTDVLPWKYARFSGGFALTDK